MVRTSFPPRHHPTKVLYSDAFEKNSTFYAWDLMKDHNEYFVFCYCDTHLDTIEGPFSSLESGIDFILMELTEKNG